MKKSITIPLQNISVNLFSIIFIRTTVNGVLFVGIKTKKRRKQKKMCDIIKCW